MYVALTEMGKRKFIEAGLPADRIMVKPNYMPDPGPGGPPRDYVVFVGRLSQEKGIRLLLEAWRDLSDIPLKLVGDGPLESYARETITRHHLNVFMEGRRSHDEVIDLIKGSRFVVFPSLCYESFGRPILEAYACGRPVVGPRSGTSLELIKHARTGLHFIWNDAADLARRVRSLWSDDALLRESSRAARQEYLAKFTPERNYETLMAIYDKVLYTARS